MAENDLLTAMYLHKLDIRFGIVEADPRFAWEKLKPKYQNWLKHVRVTRFNAARLQADIISRLLPVYNPIAKETNVPVSWIGAINYRESSNSLYRYFGNGDPLNHKTVHVPKGRGPFKNFQEGCLDALRMMKLANLNNWTLDYFCWQSERYNGFGYEMHGVPSPYVFGGTNIQTRGKYEEDGHWNGGAWDTQLGVLPIYYALVSILPSLAIPQTG